MVYKLIEITFIFLTTSIFLGASTDQLFTPLKKNHGDFFFILARCVFEQERRNKNYDLFRVCRFVYEHFQFCGNAKQKAISNLSFVWRIRNNFYT